MAVDYNSDETVVQETVDTATAARFYTGFMFRNSTGAAITVAIYDGTTTGGALIDSVVVPANGSLGPVLYPRPLKLTSGNVFVDWTTGIVGNIRVIV